MGRARHAGTLDDLPLRSVPRRRRLAGARATREIPLDRPIAARIVAASVLVVASVAATLAVSGRLHGPTLVAAGTAPAETSLAIVVGAVYGWRVATRARTPWW